MLFSIYSATLSNDGVKPLLRASLTRSLKVNSRCDIERPPFVQADIYSSCRASRAGAQALFFTISSEMLFGTSMYFWNSMVKVARPWVWEPG